jgi:hypothetical protein
MFDHSELDDFARRLTVAPTRVLPALVPVAGRAGMNIKRVMKSDASGHRHLKGLESKVGYEVEVDATSVAVEVGFIDQGIGELANIAAFGTSKNAPVMDITRGLTEEVPRFIAATLKAARDAL